MKNFFKSPAKVFNMLTGLLIAGMIYAAFTALPAQAQDVTAGAASGSTATSSTEVQSASGAISSGNTLVLPAQPSQTTVKQDGTATLKTAPSLGGLALGGGHPCAMAPMTAQISVIGGGLGYGGMEVDEACMLLIMAAAAQDAKAYNAATYMMAARDQEACAAMYQAGMVADCVDSKGRSRVKAAPTVSSNSGATRPVARTVSLDVECRRTGNKITPVVSKAVWDMYGREAVMNACR